MYQGHFSRSVQSWLMYLFSLCVHLFLNNFINSLSIPSRNPFHDHPNIKQHSFTIIFPGFNFLPTFSLADPIFLKNSLLIISSPPGGKLHGRTFISHAHHSCSPPSTVLAAAQVLFESVWRWMNTMDYF